MRPAATPFAFAGVYDVWKGRNGPAITSFALVTTDAAPSVAQYHNRMPVVLDNGQFDDWMRGSPSRQRQEQSAGTHGTCGAAPMSDDSQSDLRPASEFD